MLSLRAVAAVFFALNGVHSGPAISQFLQGDAGMQ